MRDIVFEALSFAPMMEFEGTFPDLRLQRTRADAHEQNYTKSSKFWSMQYWTTHLPLKYRS
jgi:hypothetical protein